MEKLAGEIDFCAEKVFCQSPGLNPRPPVRCSEGGGKEDLQVTPPVY